MCVCSVCSVCSVCVMGRKASKTRLYCIESSTFYCIETRCFPSGPEIFFLFNINLEMH